MNTAHEPYHWLDVQRIGEELVTAYPDIDPLSITFPRLREMVRGLPGFRELSSHPPNERILEAIQEAWMGEIEDEDDCA